MDVKRKLSRLEKWFSGANLVKFATTFNICIRPQRHLKILQLHERERKVKQNHGQFRLLVLEKTCLIKKNSMLPLSKSNQTQFIMVGVSCKSETLYFESSDSIGAISLHLLLLLSHGNWDTVKHG